MAKVITLRGLLKNPFFILTLLLFTWSFFIRRLFEMPIESLIIIATSLLIILFLIFSLITEAKAQFHRLW